MTSRRAFGRTWWGNAWVEAMERIDYDTNRLPRGRTYARDGSVLEIRVEGPTVYALVQGRRRKPYDVGFRVKPFSRAEISKVKLLLSGNPALAYAMGLGKLPERMLDMLEDAGVHLFPRSWKEIEAHCSCPDWANPCKHLAAVYYLVANEIDKDPFLVFELRGIPAASLREAAELAETGWGGETAKASRDEPAFVPWREAEAVPPPEDWMDLDLSFPRLDLDAVFTLLEDAPLFWEGGDFKKVLRKAYRAVAAAAEDPVVEEEFPSLRGVDFYLLYEGSAAGNAAVDAPLGTARAAPSFFLALDGDDSPHPERVARMISAVAEDERGSGPGPEKPAAPRAAQRKGAAPRTARREGAAPRAAQRKLPVRRGEGLEMATRKGVMLDADPVLDFFLTLPLETDLRRYSPSSRALCAAGATALALARSHLYVPELIPLSSGGFGLGEAAGERTERTGGNAHKKSGESGKSGGSGESGERRQARGKGQAGERASGDRGKETREKAEGGAEEQGGFRVRYVPLLTEDKVRRALDSLEALLPRELAYRRTGQAVPAPGYARHLVALFLDRAVRRHAVMPGGLEGDKLLRAFFAGGTYRPRKFAERRTLASVANWMERLYIRGKAVSPVVRVELIEAPSRGGGLAGGFPATEIGPGPRSTGPGEEPHAGGLEVTPLGDGLDVVPRGGIFEGEPHGGGLDVTPHAAGTGEEPYAGGLFGLHLDVEDREDPMAPMLSLAEVFAAEEEVFSRPAAPLKRDLARQIAVAGEYLPQLADILNSRGVMSAVIGPAEMAELLTRHAAVLGVLGIRLVLPRELARLLSPRLALRASFPGSSKAVKYLSLAQMLDFDWEICVGDTALSREEFLELARFAGGVVRFREGYVLLDPAEARRLLENITKPPPRPEAAEFLHWLLAGERDGVELRADKALERWLRKLTRPERVEVPSALVGELRPYQERGYAWLFTNAARGLGSCLADDMGLGKTIQAIALVLALREKGGLSGDGNGGKSEKGGKRKSAAGSAPARGDAVKAGDGGGQEDAAASGDGPGAPAGAGGEIAGNGGEIAAGEDGDGGRPHLVVCPTSVVGNWHKEVERFAPSLRASIYHGSERRLRTKGVDLVITTYGTLRRDLEKFKARRWGALIIDEAQNIKNPSTAQARAVKALKADCRVALSGTPVENHLGELWSIFDFLNPGYLGSLESFRKTYAVPIEKYRDGERIERLRRVTSPFVMRRLKSDKSIIPDLPEKIVAEEYCYLTPEQAALYQRVVDEVMELIESSEGMRRRGNVLKLITSLKQICDHPALFAKRGKVEARLSGKAARCLSLLENVLAAGEKALVFTQYVEMGELLLQMIEEELGERPLFFHGGVPRRARDEMVRVFQEGGGHPIMLVSLRAGGTGLNLTAASNVVHYDLWWNPAVEEQATDRTYRIGQERNVYVHRLITLNTFEERIDEMMRAKRELAELTVSAGEKWITELSDRELRDIFSLRPDPQP